MLFWIAIAIAVAIIIYVIISWFKPGRYNTQPIEVNLEELASGWLKFNFFEEKQTDNKNIHIEEGTEGVVVSELVEFYKELIEPYEELFKQQNALELLKECLQMLDSHGQAPSVVIDVKDNESIDLISVRDNLTRITLRQHTMNVTRNIINLVNENYSEPENFMPQAIIVALAHDIGKIPELRLSGAYNSYDHAIVSSNWLAEQFAGKEIFWAKQAVVAVRDHHLKSNDSLTAMLRQADHQARQMELIRFTQNYEIKSFDLWFSLEDFLKQLESRINVTARGKMEAFSFKGVIYVKPDCLYEVAKQMMFEKRVLDMIFLYESEKENATRKIVTRLRDRDLIPDIIAPQYISRKFEIRMKMQIKRQYQVMIAIRVEPFKDRIEELESRKAGTQLELIEAVIPV